MQVKTKKAIVGMSITIVSIALVVGIIFASFAIAGSSYNKRYQFSKVAEASAGSDKIHFLNTGGSDCILLESEGKFGMVDCAEDNDNPRNFSSLNINGYEQKVIDYVKKVAGDKDGKVTLEFILGTHAHSDHIGGFDTLLNDKSFSVKTAYVKRYYEDRISNYEVSKWDNKEVYTQLVDAVNANGVTLVQDLVDLKFKLGNFDLTIFNGEEPTPGLKVGENENSIALLVDNGKHRALLNGDLNNKDGDEDRVAQRVGKVEIMKVGHHGLPYSSTGKFVKTVNPDICIVPSNNLWYYGTRFNLSIVAKSAIYVTGEQDGIILDVGGEKIQCFNNIH